MGYCVELATVEAHLVEGLAMVAVQLQLSTSAAQLLHQQLTSSTEEAEDEVQRQLLVTSSPRSEVLRE